MSSEGRLIAYLIFAIVIIICPVYSVAQASVSLPPTITLEDLPDGFVADEEINNASEDWNPETEIEFGFTDVDNGTLLYGMTIQVEPEEFPYIVELIKDPDAYLDSFMNDSDFVSDVIRGTVVRHKTIGDNSVIVSVDHYYEDSMNYLANEFGDTERVDQVLFTSGDMVAMVLLGYPVTNPPSFSIEYIGSLWAERIVAAAENAADYTDTAKADSPTTTLPPTPTTIATPEATLDLPLLVLDDLPQDFIVATDEESEELIGELAMDEVAEPLGASAYVSDFEQEAIISILFDLQDPMMRLASSMITANPSALLEMIVASVEFKADPMDIAVDSTIDIGEASAAFSLLIPTNYHESDFLLDMQYEILWFEKEPYAGILMLFYPFDESPEYTLSELAGIWESQIQNAMDSNKNVLEAIPAADDEADATILATALNVRSGPGMIYGRTGSLKRGDDIAILGRNGDCSWIEVETQDALVGWVSTSPNYIELHIDCEDAPVASIRPSTGLMVDKYTTLGWGELTIDNGSEFDQFVLLTDLNKNIIAAAYIRYDENYTLEDIPEGEYLVFFTGGSDWNDGENGFDNVASYSMFEDSFDFIVKGEKISMWSITLHPVVGGNAETSRVDLEDFPIIE